MNLCANCMQEKGDAKKCPHCGYEGRDDSQLTAYLKENTLLCDRFMVGRVLGQGGFGITYLGFDTFLSQKIAIKEYYPSDLAQRIPGEATVSAYTSGNSTNDYEHGKARFIEEARTLAKFSDHPGIVGIRDCIEANGTAYIIMQYLEGVTLKEYLKQNGGRLDPNLAVSILMPVMDALRAVHKVGIIHRDISPDNIFITKSSQVKLLDFGAARQSMGGQKSLSVMLKPGYAPEEQYRTGGNQGPWTDVYALSATLYKMITGNVPPDSLERLLDDTLVIPENLPENIKAALRKGLAVRAAERFDSVDALQNTLLGNAPVTPTTSTPKPPKPTPPEPKPAPSETADIGKTVDPIPYSNTAAPATQAPATQAPAAAPTAAPAQSVPQQNTSGQSYTPVSGVEDKVETIRSWYNQTNSGASDSSLSKTQTTVNHGGKTYSSDQYFKNGELYFVFAYNGSIENRLYFWDGTLFRWIDESGIIHDNEFGNADYLAWQAQYAGTSAPVRQQTQTQTGAQAVTNSEISDFAESSLRAFVRGISNKNSSYVSEYFGGNAVDEEMHSYSVITKNVASEEILSLDCSEVNRLSDSRATVIRRSTIRVFYNDGSVKDISEAYRYDVLIYDDGSMKITALTEL